MLWYNKSLQEMPFAVLVTPKGSTSVRRCSMAIIPQKCCSDCGVLKSISEFPPKQGRCKPCFYAYVNRRRAERRKDPVLSAQDTAAKVAYNRIWQEKHRQQYRKYQEQYRAEHPIQMRAYEKKWRQSNPDNLVARAHRRKARIKGNGGSYTAKEWRALCAHYDHRCLCCGEQKPLTVDHVIPVSKGGVNTISNIQPLCGPCNSSKGDKTIDYRARAIDAAAH
jgi:5-methylcytosine-specific restriction endonuclease McrA